MNWLLMTLLSSIGKKQIMAVTGLCFCLFLATHLAGNFMIYGGKEMLDAYSVRLHSFGLLISAFEAGLLVLAVLHVFLATILYVQNLYARPARYAVNKNAGGRTLSSFLMPYTGLYLVIFVVIHLFTFHFVDRTNQTISQIVEDVFSRPLYVVFYIFSVIVAAVHVKHGLWSAFQTIGVDHPKYTPLIKWASLIFSLIVGAGFGSVPLFVMAGG
jgi:succinate dehydrogenase / fumarate reductase cytochrome b subunit